MSSGYVGVKFQTELIRANFAIDSRLDRLKYWCKVFHEKGLAPPYEGGSYGNLSFRIKENKDAYIITASQSSLNESDSNDRFVAVPHVDLKRGIVYAIGSRKPSSEAMVHHAIYHARPEIFSVFHGHCAKISRDAEKLGIPITSREEPYGTIFLVDRVLESLDETYFLEMKNHGFISLGKSMDEAGNIALRYLRESSRLPEKSLLSS